MNNDITAELRAWHRGHRRNLILARLGLCAAVLLAALGVGAMVATDHSLVAAALAGAVFLWGLWSVNYLLARHH